jgi:hypothetical protein
MSTSPPTERCPVAGRPWFLTAILLIAYGVSFGLPAAGRFVISNEITMTSGMMGWEAFLKAWDSNGNYLRVPGYYVWYANGWFWVGCILLLLRLGRWATLMGAAGTLTGLAVYVEHWQHGWNSQFLIGYWLWIASIAALIPAGIFQWRRGRRAALQEQAGNIA